LSHEIAVGRGITLTLAWDEVLPPQIDPSYRTASGIASHYHEARLTFEGVEIDQTYLAETHLQLQSLLALR